MLEPPKVGMIGLSNWQLDAAKMNRAVHASRLPLRAADFVLTANKVMKSKNLDFEPSIL